MAEARSREAWAHTSAILALLWNVNIDPQKASPKQPNDFNPFAQKLFCRKKPPSVVDTGDGFEILKMVFCPGQ